MNWKMTRSHIIQFPFMSITEMPCDTPHGICHVIQNLKQAQCGNPILGLKRHGISIIAYVYISCVVGWKNSVNLPLG